MWLPAPTRLFLTSACVPKDTPDSRTLPGRTRLKWPISTPSAISASSITDAPTRTRSPIRLSRIWAIGPISHSRPITVAPRSTVIGRSTVSLPTLHRGVHVGGGRVLDGDPAEHQRLQQAAPQHRLGGGELAAIVDPHRLLGVGGEHAPPPRGRASRSASVR